MHTTTLPNRTLQHTLPQSSSPLPHNSNHQPLQTPPGYTYNPDHCTTINHPPPPQPPPHTLPQHSLPPTSLTSLTHPVSPHINPACTPANYANTTTTMIHIKHPNPAQSTTACLNQTRPAQHPNQRHRQSDMVRAEPALPVLEPSNPWHRCKHRMNQCEIIRKLQP